ncbi:TIGR03986 family CRISPR-associated RAMP protein, partial [bacterium]|nr:TIGR03986 family CRISPR-associated RAMP protein [candidate division CSSED10-310 bacterium]
MAGNNWNRPKNPQNPRTHQPGGSNAYKPPAAKFNEPQPLLDHIPSPYNFVPLSRNVVLLDETRRRSVSQDVPVSDGLSGTLKLTVKAVSPIYIRNGGAHPIETVDKNTHPDYTDFYRLYPEGPYGIPGSSIKGMIRSVVEIASFSKMKLVDDHRYSIRNLDNQKAYTDHLTDSKSGAYEPRAMAGWLKDGGNGQWHLYPCSFGRVEQSDLARYHGNGFKPWIRQSGVKKYTTWLNTFPNMKLRCRIGKKQRHTHGHGAFIYSKVDQLGNGPHEGVVVLTGQPAEWDPDKPGSWKRKKHMEFVFFDPKSEPVEIPQKLKEEFVFVHCESNGLPNEEWKYWKKKMQAGERVPVFYLGTEQKPTSMGLAMMYRLPYQFSIGEAIAHSCADHRNPILDFSEGLFGCVNDTAGIKGRIWFRPMTVIGDPKPQGKVVTILNSPKPTFYANYVEQQGGSNGQAGADYTTFMDEDCTIRGWKRYPVRRTNPSPIKPLDNQKKLETAFRPMPVGTQFTGEISFHNVRPEELGAVVWAIHLG